MSLHSIFYLNNPSLNQKLYASLHSYKNWEIIIDNNNENTHYNYIAELGRNNLIKDFANISGNLPDNEINWRYIENSIFINSGDYINCPFS